LARSPRCRSDRYSKEIRRVLSSTNALRLAAERYPTLCDAAERRAGRTRAYGASAHAAQIFAPSWALFSECEGCSPQRGGRLDTGAHRWSERNRNRHADAHPEARCYITVPRRRRGRRGRRESRGRGSWLSNYTHVRCRVVYGPWAALGCVTHPRRRQCDECKRRERGRDNGRQALNYAHHRRSSIGSSRPCLGQNRTKLNADFHQDLAIRVMAPGPACNVMRRCTICRSTPTARASTGSDPAAVVAGCA
jgi:hypothetical protein